MFQLFRTEYTGSTTTPNTVPTEFICIMNQALNKNNIKNNMDAQGLASPTLQNLLTQTGILPSAFLLRGVLSSGSSSHALHK